MCVSENGGCGKTLPSLISDPHLWCIQCRGFECSPDSPCSTCVKWCNSQWSLYFGAHNSVFEVHSSVFGDESVVNSEAKPEVRPNSEGLKPVFSESGDQLETTRPSKSATSKPRGAGSDSQSKKAKPKTKKSSSLGLAPKKSAKRGEATLGAGNHVPPPKRSKKGDLNELMFPPNTKAELSLVSDSIAETQPGLSLAPCSSHATSDQTQEGPSGVHRPSVALVQPGISESNMELNSEKPESFSPSRVTPAPSKKCSKPRKRSMNGDLAMPQGLVFPEGPTPALMPEKSKQKPSSEPTTTSPSSPSRPRSGLQPSTSPTPTLAPVLEPVPGPSFDISSIVKKAVEEFLTSNYNNGASPQSVIPPKPSPNLAEAAKRMKEARDRFLANQDASEFFPDLDAVEHEEDTYNSDSESGTDSDSSMDDELAGSSSEPVPLAFPQIMSLIRRANGLSEAEDFEEEDFQSEVHKVLNLKKSQKPPVSLPWSNQVKQAMASASKEAIKSPEKTSEKKKRRWLPIPALGASRYYKPTGEKLKESRYSRDLADLLDVNLETLEKKHLSLSPTETGGLVRSLALALATNSWMERLLASLPEFLPDLQPQQQQNLSSFMQCGIKSLSHQANNLAVLWANMEIKRRENAFSEAKSSIVKDLLPSLRKNPLFKEDIVPAEQIRKAAEKKERSLQSKAFSSAGQTYHRQRPTPVMNQLSREAPRPSVGLYRRDERKPFSSQKIENPRERSRPFPSKERKQKPGRRQGGFRKKF